MYVHLYFLMAPAHVCMYVHLYVVFTILLLSVRCRIVGAFCLHSESGVTTFNLHKLLQTLIQGTRCIGQKCRCRLWMLA